MFGGNVIGPILGRRDRRLPNGGHRARETIAKRIMGRRAAQFAPDRCRNQTGFVDARKTKCSAPASELMAIALSIRCVSMPFVVQTMDHCRSSLGTGRST